MSEITIYLLSQIADYLVSLSTTIRLYDKSLKLIKELISTNKKEYIENGYRVTFSAGDESTDEYTVYKAELYDTSSDNVLAYFTVEKTKAFNEILIVEFYIDLTKA